jgi:hypothetical protein
MRWDNAEIVEREVLRPWAEGAPLLVRGDREVLEVEYDPETRTGFVRVIVRIPIEGEEVRVPFELRDNPKGGPPILVVTS